MGTFVAYSGTQIIAAIIPMGSRDRAGETTILVLGEF